VSKESKEQEQQQQQQQQQQGQENQESPFSMRQVWGYEFEKFTRIPNVLLMHAGALGVSGDHFQLIATIHMFKWTRKTSFVSIPDLCKYTRWSERKVQRNLADLIDKEDADEHAGKEKKPESERKYKKARDPLYLGFLKRVRDKSGKKADYFDFSPFYAELWKYEQADKLGVGVAQVETDAVNEDEESSYEPPEPITEDTREITITLHGATHKVTSKELYAGYDRAWKEIKQEYPDYDDFKHGSPSHVVMFTEVRKQAEEYAGPASKDLFIALAMKNLLRWYVESKGLKSVRPKVA